MEILSIKNAISLILAGAGTVIASFIGGWDAAVQSLVVFMGIDFVTGMLVALVFHKSGKSSSGSAESKACFKGIVRKVFMLVCVGIGVMLDRLLGLNLVCRTAIVLFFIGNEGLSVLENLGKMGLPFPSVLKNALESLRDKGSNIKGG